MLAYIALIVISAWASGASISTHFNLPPALGYALGAAFSIIAALLLTSLQRSIENKKIGWTIVSVLVFLLAWGASLLTNTHSFFILSNMDSIRQTELKAASNELQLIGSQTEGWFGNIIDSFETAVNADARQLRQQILAPGNCGVGPESEQIISRLGELLRSTITRYKVPPSGSQCPQAYQPVADAYVNTILGQLKERTTELERNKSRALEELDVTGSEKLRVEIDAALENYDQQDMQRTEFLLEKAFQKVDAQHKIMEKFIGIDEVNTNPLPTEPESKRLRKIDYLPTYIDNHGGYGATGVLFSLAIALIVDLGAFIIFWRFVINREED
ncbi:MAG: hypothetical protein WBA17_15125 [Saprospiraceae bacterium]